MHLEIICRQKIETAGYLSGYNNDRNIRGELEFDSQRKGVSIKSIFTATAWREEVVIMSRCVQSVHLCFLSPSGPLIGWEGNILALKTHYLALKKFWTQYWIQYWTHILNLNIDYQYWLPILNPILYPILNPILNPILKPILNPILSPILNPNIEPNIGHSIEHNIEPDIEPQY